MLDKNCKKVLKFFIKNSNKSLTIVDLKSHFDKDSNLNLISIITYLCENKYIRTGNTNEYILTNTGLTYFSLSRSKWISENIISILALVVSILAFIEATISLIIDFYK